MANLSGMVTGVSKTFVTQHPWWHLIAHLELCVTSSWLGELQDHVQAYGLNLLFVPPLLLIFKSFLGVISHEISWPKISTSCLPCSIQAPVCYSTVSTGNMSLMLMGVGGSISKFSTSLLPYQS